MTQNSYASDRILARQIREAVKRVNELSGQASNTGLAVQFRAVQGDCGCPTNPCDLREIEVESITRYL